MILAAIVPSLLKVSILDKKQRDVGSFSRNALFVTNLIKVGLLW